MRYGYAIRVLRAVSGMTQKELAVKAQLDQSYVSLLESGRRVPGVTALQCITQALHCSLPLLAALARDPSDAQLSETDTSTCSTMLWHYVVSGVSPNHRRGVTELDSELGYPTRFFQTRV